MTIRQEFFKGLTDWSSITGQPPDQGFLIYGGNSDHIPKHGTVISWRNVEKVAE